MASLDGCLEGAGEIQDGHRAHCRYVEQFRKSDCRQLGEAVMPSDPLQAITCSPPPLYVLESEIWWPRVLDRRQVTNGLPTRVNEEDEEVFDGLGRWLPIRPDVSKPVHPRFRRERQRPARPIGHLLVAPLNKDRVWQQGRPNRPRNLIWYRYRLALDRHASYHTRCNEKKPTKRLDRITLSGGDRHACSLSGRGRPQTCRYRGRRHQGARASPKPILLAEIHTANQSRAGASIAVGRQETEIRRAS